MIHLSSGDDNDGIEDLARGVGVLRYEGPINTCAQCSTPCSGVMCLSCATK